MNGLQAVFSWPVLFLISVIKWIIFVFLFCFCLLSLLKPCTEVYFVLLTMDNYDCDSRSSSRLNTLEASIVGFRGIFTERLYQSYDIGVAGHYKSISSKYLFKDGIQSEYGDDRGLNVFHLNCQWLNSSFKFLNEICDLSIFHVIGLTET